MGCGRAGVIGGMDEVGAMSGVGEELAQSRSRSDPERAPRLSFGLPVHNGEASIRRASHVEPEGTAWVADMSPVNGPKLGPYTRRADALDAERRWLEAGNIPEVRDD